MYKGLEPYEFLRSLRLAKSKMIRDFVPPTEKNKLFILLASLRLLRNS
jgi:hypothetical protein